MLGTGAGSTFSSQSWYVISNAIASSRYSIASIEASDFVLDVVIGLARVQELQRLRHVARERQSPEVMVQKLDDSSTGPKSPSNTAKSSP